MMRCAIFDAWLVGGEIVVDVEVAEMIEQRAHSLALRTGSGPQFGAGQCSKGRCVALAQDRASSCLVVGIMRLPCVVDKTCV